MSNGRFGIHGGQYIPETLMNAIHELEEAYNRYKDDPEFNAELDELMRNYVGRPSLLYYAEKMTKDLGGAKIYLKLTGLKANCRIINLLILLPIFLMKRPYLPDLNMILI